MEFQHSYLLDLPTELVEWIAEYTVNIGALLNLRLTCKSICSRTLSVVAKRYFSDRSFYIADQTSLGTFYDISKHETFSKSMRCIHLSQAVLEETSFYDYLGRMRENPDLDDTIAARTRDARVRHRNLRREYDILIRAQREFRDEEGDLLYLKVILYNFRLAGNIPALIITGESEDDCSTKGKPWGYKRLCRMMGYTKCLSSGPRIAYRFALLQRAIVASQFPITELELGCRWLGLRPDTLKLFTQNGGFTSLKSLRLTMGEQGPPRGVSRCDYIVDMTGHFAAFLSAVPLETLVFRNYCRSERVGMHNLMFAAIQMASEHTACYPETPRPFRRLRTLELHGQNARLCRLIQFVSETKATLRSLHLEDVHDLDLSHSDVETSLREAHGGDNFDVYVGWCFQSNGRE